VLFTLKNIAKYTNFGGKCKEKQENIKKAQCRCLYLETNPIAWRCTGKAGSSYYCDFFECTWGVDFYGFPGVSPTHYNDISAITNAQ